MIPLAALAFAITHVAFEHFNGGIRTHHFLARADLPGFPNWLGLAILPLLGFFLAARVRSAQGSEERNFLPPAIIAGLAGSLAYGALLAGSFHLGLEQVSLAAFLGLFLCSIFLPIYRAEYVFGFVVGMTITFGSVIPLFFAAFFAGLSFALRRGAAFVLAAVRRRPR